MEVVSSRLSEARCQALCDALAGIQPSDNSLSLQPRPPSLPNTCVCLKVATVPSAQSLRLLDFTFSDFELSDTETTLATVRMFVDLNLVQNFQMKYTVGTHLPAASSW